MDDAAQSLMRRTWMVGVSAVLGCLLAILLMTDPMERVLVLLGIVAAAFVAGALLARDDAARKATASEAVRRALLERVDVGDAAYASQITDVDRELAIAVRRAVAQCFDVPPAKIHPTDDLRRDYHYGLLGTDMEFFVVEQICAERGIETRPYTMFCADNEASIGAYTAFIKQLLVEFEATEDAAT